MKKKYNFRQVCSKCGGHYQRLSQHLTLRKFNERDLLAFRKKHRIRIRKGEILHIFDDVKMKL